MFSSTASDSLQIFLNESPSRPLNRSIHPLLALKFSTLNSSAMSNAFSLKNVTRYRNIIGTNDIKPFY